MLNWQMCSNFLANCCIDRNILLFDFVCLSTLNVIINNLIDYTLWNYPTIESIRHKIWYDFLDVIIE